MGGAPGHGLGWGCLTSCPFRLDRRFLSFLFQSAEFFEMLEKMQVSSGVSVRPVSQVCPPHARPHFAVCQVPADSSAPAAAAG